MVRRPPSARRFPYTTLFRSASAKSPARQSPETAAKTRRPPPARRRPHAPAPPHDRPVHRPTARRPPSRQQIGRHTSELQSHVNLVCRLLLEKKHAALRRAGG